MRTFTVLPTALALAAALLAGCGGGGSSKEGGTKTIAGVSANDHGSRTAESSGKTEVELDDFYFDPTVIKGKPGEKVTLELKNDSSTEHNFTVDSQKVDQDVEGGKSAEVTVTIPQSGELSFYCKYHKSSGMAGALEASG